VKLRGAVVGVGYLGNFHAQKYRDLSKSTFAGKIEFIGVCDANKEQANKVALEVGVKAYFRPEDLIGQVDLVTIAAATSSHYSLAKLFLQNGVHVNVEKPMTVRVEEADELIALSQSKGRVLCVGHSERFNPAYREMMGQLKKPLYAELARHAPYKARGADVSVVHDLMIHDLDLLLKMDSGPFELSEVSGGRFISPSLDWAAATLSFSSGFKARLSASRMAPTLTRQLRVVCRDQSFDVNLQTGDLVISEKVSGEVALKQTAKNCGKGDNLMLETEAFFQAALAEKKPFITGVDGRSALALAEAIVQQVEASK
jgi:predicted dehydrogenase